MPNKDKILETLNLQVDRTNELEKRIDEAIEELSEFSKWLTRTNPDQSYAWLLNKTKAIQKIKQILRGTIQEEAYP